MGQLAGSEGSSWVHEITVELQVHGWRRRQSLSFLVTDGILFVRREGQGVKSQQAHLRGHRLQACRRDIARDSRGARREPSANEPDCFWHLLC